MCRLAIVISNKNIQNNYIANIFWFKEHSIFKQCYKEPYTPYDENNPRNHNTNLDGYGIGFFVKKLAKKYTNIIPSWNDVNLFHILPYIKTKILMIHLRAVDPLVQSNFKYIGNQSKTPVHSFNCHPFVYNEWMFSHNGFIESFYNGKSRKKIINKIDDDLLLNIMGNTDSEYLFYLILTYIKKGFDTVTAIKKVFIYLNKISKKLTISINIIITNGIQTYSTRYINKENLKPPSLYYIKNHDNIIISSEPFDKSNDLWELVPKNSLIIVKNKKINISNI